MSGSSSTGGRDGGMRLDRCRPPRRSTSCAPGSGAAGCALRRSGVVAVRHFHGGLQCPPVAGDRRRSPPGGARAWSQPRIEIRVNAQPARCRRPAARRPVPGTDDRADHPRRSCRRVRRHAHLRGPACRPQAHAGRHDIRQMADQEQSTWTPSTACSERRSGRPCCTALARRRLRAGRRNRADGRARRHGLHGRGRGSHRRALRRAVGQLGA